MDNDKNPLDSTFPSTSKPVDSEPENLKRPFEPKESEGCKKTKHDLAQVSVL